MSGRSEGRAVNQEREHRWGHAATAGDWGDAVIVALVLSVATLIGAIAIAAFDNAARFASRYGPTSLSEMAPTAQEPVSPETDARAR